MFRWKLFHYVLPCKRLIAIWKISNSPLCNMCEVVEDYEHMFITCEYFGEFWEKIRELLKKLKIGNHVINLKNLVFGYKIQDEKLFWLNFLLLIILFSINKIYYLSEQKTKRINVFNLFKYEFLKRLEVWSFRKSRIDPNLNIIEEILIHS